MILEPKGLGYVVEGTTIKIIIKDQKQEKPEAGANTKDSDIENEENQI
jgi:hypothetical protein